MIKKCRIFLICCLHLSAGTSLNAQVALERVSPESQGISSQDVKSYFDAMLSRPNGEPHGVMVLRRGKVVGELFPAPFSKDYSHTIYSASKTFVAVAVGIAIEENRIRLTDRVATFFPDLLPDTIPGFLADMTIRDLLTMTSGIQPDWLMRTKGAEWARRYLNNDFSHKPGETFQYDSMASYILSAIIQQVSGRKLIDYLKPRVFDPLAITEAEWEESPEGINTGGWGLRLRVESMAKFGQLLLNKGEWEGKRLIPADWVEEMTSSLQETGMQDTYGYQVWRCDYPDAYRADGALGQYIIVAPNEEMVVAITQANTGNGVAERQLVWELLRKAGKDTLSENGAFDALKETERNYSLPVAKGKRTRKALALFEGKEFNLTHNEMDWKSIRIDKKEGDTLTMTVSTLTGESYVILAGNEKWLTSRTDAYPPYTIRAVDRFKGLRKDFHVSACYGGSGKELCLKVRYVDWVSGADLTFHRNKEDDTLTMTVKENSKRNAYEITLTPSTETTETTR